MSDCYLQEQDSSAAFDRAKTACYTVTPGDRSLQCMIIVQRYKSSGICQNSGSDHCNFGSSLALRLCGKAFFGIIRFFVACALILISLSEYGLLMKKQV